MTLAAALVQNFWSRYWMTSDTKCEWNFLCSPLIFIMGSRNWGFPLKIDLRAFIFKAIQLIVLLVFSTLFIGFSSNSKTWLPVNPNYWRINVKEQQSKSDSVYNFIKSLLTLRKTDTFMYGDFEKIILSDWVLVIKRFVSIAYTYFIK